MELAGYQPTLGKIQEEPDGEELNDFDESILLEYAILTEEDLKKALYIDNPTEETLAGCKCGEVQNEWCTFSAFHTKAATKNSHLIELNLNRNNSNCLYPDINYPDGSTGSSIINIVYEDHHNDRVRVLNNNDYDSESNYNSLNGNDSGIHNVDSRDSSIYSSQSNRKSLNGSINDSINKSLNGSISGSLFNLEEIVNASPTLPLDKQGIDFNTVTGRKIFIKAIRQKYMNIYYVVSQQRLSGDFIGNQSVATFVMILNSLEIRQVELQGDYFRTHSLSDEMTFTDIAAVARDNKLSAEISQVFKESCISNFR